MNGSSSVKIDPGGQVEPSSTESTMERAALALAESRVYGGYNPETKALLTEQQMYGARRDVRLVLEAIREPTEAQYEALSATGLMWRELDSKTVWHTYIDAALSGAQGEARASTGTPDGK